MTPSGAPNTLGRLTMSLPIERPERNTEAAPAKPRACSKCEWFDPAVPAGGLHGVCRIPAADGTFPRRWRYDWCHRYAPAGSVIVESSEPGPPPPCYVVGIDRGDEGKVDFTSSAGAADW